MVCPVRTSVKDAPALYGPRCRKMRSRRCGHARSWLRRAQRRRGGLPSPRLVTHAARKGAIGRFYSDGNYEETTRETEAGAAQLIEWSPQTSLPCELSSIQSSAPGSQKSHETLARRDRRVMTLPVLSLRSPVRGPRIVEVCSLLDLARGLIRMGRKSSPPVQRRS